MKTKEKFRVLHTDSVLRKHGLLLVQDGEPPKAKFSYVDWISHRPAAKKRIDAFEDDAFSSEK